MTKDPRKPERWSNVEIQHDGDGYRQAIENRREDRAQEEQDRQYADDLARYTATFVENGGREQDAEAAFIASRNQTAAEAANQADTAAATAGRRRIRSAL